MLTSGDMRPWISSRQVKERGLTKDLVVKQQKLVAAISASALTQPPFRMGTMRLLHTHKSAEDKKAHCFFCK